MALHINIIAIIVAVVINFILGFIWYTALFSKACTKEMGYDPNMRPDKKLGLREWHLLLLEHFFLYGYLHSSWQVGNIFLVQKA
jgi:Protein of unknown function (DUF1761)